MHPYRAKLLIWMQLLIQYGCEYQSEVFVIAAEVRERHAQLNHDAKGWEFTGRSHGRPSDRSLGGLKDRNQSI